MSIDIQYDIFTYTCMKIKNKTTKKKKKEIDRIRENKIRSPAGKLSRLMRFKVDGAQRSERKKWMKHNGKGERRVRKEFKARASFMNKDIE